MEKKKKKCSFAVSEPLTSNINHKQYTIYFLTQFYFLIQNVVTWPQLEGFFVIVVVVIDMLSFSHSFALLHDLAI